jgi:hypothetical protein
MTSARVSAAAVDDVKDRDPDIPATETPVSLEEAGLIGPALYQSPQYGYTVAWEDPWDLSTLLDESVSTDPGSRRDDLNLKWGPDDPHAASLRFAGIERGTHDLEAEHARALDPEQYERYWPDLRIEVVGSGISDTRSAVLYHIHNDELRVGRFELRQVVHYEPDCLIGLTLYAGPEVLTEVLRSAAEDVLLDEEQVMDLLDIGEIESWLEDVAG